jgi:hypothetical protein
MPSLPIRHVVKSFFAAAVALLLVVAGIASSTVQVAQAAENVSITLTPSAVSAGPGDSLSATVSVTNSGSTSLPAGEAVITAGSAALSTVADLDAWFAAEDKDTQPGRFLAAIDIPELAAGKTVDVAVDLPLASGRFGGIWGARGLAVDYLLDNNSAAAGRSSFVWTAGSAPEKTSFTGILPLVSPPSTSGLLSATELTELTGPSGILTRQLSVAQGRSVTLGVDPRILTSIEALGESAPEGVVAWLALLKSLPNESFLLAYADADISAQAQAGAGSLLIPSTTDVITPAVLSGSTPIPAPTATPLPASEPLFTPTLNNLGWPAANSVIASDLGIFTSSGMASGIFSSANIAGENISRGVVSGLPSVVTINGLSSALNTNNVSRSASYLAAAAQDESAAGRSYASLPRETFSITGLTKLGMVLDTLASLQWVSSGTISSGLSSASAELEIVDSPESSQRISVVSGLLARNSALTSFSSIAEEPELITSPASREVAAVLSVGWLGDGAWTTAVTQSMRASEKILNSVSVVTSSTINMVGGQANIPISIHNSLLQPVTVVVNADPNNARLIVKGSERVTIQPESQAKAQIPVQAQVSNGSAILTVSMQSVDGVPVGEPVAIPVNVRADWETWGLGAVALAFVGLLTAGVIRTVRRRKNGISVPS